MDVREAYGLKPEDDPIQVLFEHNQELAAAESEGKPILGLGLPPSVNDKPLPPSAQLVFSEIKRLSASSDKIFTPPCSSFTHFWRCQLRNCLFALSREAPIN